MIEGKAEEEPGARAPRSSSVPEDLRDFGHYTMLEELGRGAQGAVYLAEDTQLRRKVALKILSGAAIQSESGRERFRREAEAASKLDHPGICGIHELGEERGIPFIAMQYVRGTTLAELLADARREETTQTGSRTRLASMSPSSRAGREGMRDLLLLIERTAHALHAAHEAGLVHRDVKPANVMVTPEGQPVLLDFGLARDVGDVGDSLTETGQILGTPAYMAAEQILGRRDQIDRRTDVYALGVMLYEAVTLKRPFEARAFDELYHQILQGTPTSCRRLNPRIPKDLATIIAVAMERDPARRYSSALAMSEDLRRLRAFEPIRARAPGPITRLRKWGRRHPPQAFALCGLLLGVLGGAGFLGAQAAAQRHALTESLERAEDRLQAGDYANAFGAVARARAVAPSSARAVGLEARIQRERDAAELAAHRASDLAGAALARAESAERQREYERTRTTIVELSRELEREHALAFNAYAPVPFRSGVAAQERRLRERELTGERLVEEAREALERAARLEAPWGGTPDTEAAFADFLLGRWREAVESGDTPRTSMLRAAVERHDPAGRLASELIGRGELTLAVAPAESELFLFRYEPREELTTRDAIPRLVPVPTAGIGRIEDAAWRTHLLPGDACLVISSVTPGSPAAEVGLRAGDLVLQLDGAPLGEGLFVAPATETPSGSSELEGRRLLSVNDAPVADRLELYDAPAAAGGLDRIRFFGEDEPRELARGALRWASAQEIVERVVLGRAHELLCLHDGEPVTIALEPGGRAGIACEPTAYPLVCSGANRLRQGAPLAIDPGSYLLLARAAGFETQRLPIVVERSARAAARLDLVPEDALPPGFVYVPPGPFVRGGDPQALEPAPREVRELGGYLIARRELTNAEWDAFLADPDTQRRMRESAQLVYVPREPRAGAMPKPNLGGPATPVMGISWTDASDYVAWRNARAEAAGDPWVYELPSEDEWEKAARGVDGRAFPWGDRFDYSNAVGLYSERRHLYDAPGGLQLADESPFGLLDMAGHRQEWLRDPFEADPNAPPIYRCRGGCWRFSSEKEFRAASRGYAEASFSGGTLGLRLAARLRE